jgi:hypothetical protein
LNPRLQGYHLAKATYEPLAATPDGSIISRELGLRFALEQGDLAMFDVQTGERLLSQEELAHRERQRADEAEQRARALQDEVARLKDAAKKGNGQKRKNGKE